MPVKINEQNDEMKKNQNNKKKHKNKKRTYIKNS